MPIRIFDADRKWITEEEILWQEGTELTRLLCEHLGVYPGWDGLVNHAQYEDVKARVEAGRERFVEDMSETDEERKLWREVFPYPI